MPDIIIDTTRLLSRIVLSQELTALEKRYLENLVRADGSAKVGHWIDRTDWTVLEYGKFGHPAYECSECGYKKRTPNEGSFDPHKGGKFCDECGVRMIEREEREYFTVPICGGKNDVE